MTHSHGNEGPKLIDREAHPQDAAAPRWAVWLRRLHWPAAVLTVLLCAGLVPIAQKIGTDSTNTTFFIKESLAWYEYGQFVKKFGSDSTIIAGITLPDGLDAKTPAYLDELTHALKKIPQIESVRGLNGQTEHRMGWFGRIDEKPLLEKLSDGDETPEKFLARRSEWPPEASHLVSADGRTIALALFVKPDADDPGWGSTIGRIRAALQGVLRPGSELALTGTAVEENAFGTQIDLDSKTFVPLCVAVIVALLVLFHLDLRTVIYGLAVMGGSLVITRACMVLMDVKMQAVTALLSPVILIVAVSSTIKACGIFDLARGSRHASPAHRLADTLKGVFAPCFLANLTTFIGFMSLQVSHILAVREFGQFGAVGTAAAWFLTMVWAPLFASWPMGLRKHRLNVFEKIGWGAAWVARHAHWAILAAAVIFVALCAREIPKIETSTDLLKIFKPADTFRKETEFFMERMGGIYPLEIVLEPPAPDQMSDPAVWDRLDQFQKALGALPQVSHSIGLTDVVRYFEGVSGRPRSEAVLGKILNELPKQMKKDMKRLAAPGYSKLRFTVFLNSSNTRRVMELTREIPAAAHDALGADWEITVTGETRLLAEMAGQLVRDEIVSVVMAFGVILALIVLVMRSAPYALLGVLPNIVPIAGLFGMMAYFGIGLNTATAMIASVAIGLVFDNTVYLIYGYREARGHGMNADAAVTHALSRRFRPMFVSSIILASGFGVTMFGHMMPTVQFGLLSCVTLGLAAVSDLLVLPALLHIFKPR